jgi:hypothetical protein
VDVTIEQPLGKNISAFAILFPDIAKINPKTNDNWKFVIKFFTIENAIYLPKLSPWAFKKSGECHLFYYLRQMMCQLFKHIFYKWLKIAKGTFVHNLIKTSIKSV